MDRQAAAARQMKAAAVGTHTPQHGLYSDTMALITSDCDVMHSPSIKWP